MTRPVVDGVDGVFLQRFPIRRELTESGANFLIVDVLCDPKVLSLFWPLYKSGIIRNCINNPILMAGPKPLLTYLGLEIPHKLLVKLE